MGKIKVRYYTTRPRRDGLVGYWQPKEEMKKAGFKMVPCGPDGPAAWAIAEEWNMRWDEYRKGQAVKTWPVGSLGAAFDELRQTGIWSAKKIRTREDWERGWRYISPVFADLKPTRITVRMLDHWYRGILNGKGVREAHRAMKIWRALWQVSAALGYCDKDKDPSSAIRRETPAPRSAIWTEGEVVRLVKNAWRAGYHGLAAIITVGWESGFSPVDLRTLTFGQMTKSDGRIEFKIKRGKTGKDAIGILGKRASRLVEAYLDTLPKADHLPAAMIFRNRSKAVYSKDTLGDDFRDIRGEGETRKLMDIRRSVSVEALAGNASTEHISQKLGNNMSVNEELRQTYNPVNRAMVVAVDEARRAGRDRIRRNKPSTKV